MPWLTHMPPSPADLSWYSGYDSELSCQPNLGGQAWGEYGEKLRAKKIKFSGKAEAVTG